MSIEFKLLHLDELTRKFMVSEAKTDISTGTLYLSKDFNNVGSREYPKIICDVLEHGDMQMLADSLPARFFNENRFDKNGKTTTLNREDSAAKLAVGEYNRFYLRGLCLRAEAEGIAELVVYRARIPKNPRPESEAHVGRCLEWRALLADLRENKGRGTFLGVPMGPHSGLSAQFREGRVGMNSIPLDTI